MSGKRVIALEIALKAVLNAARDKGIDVEQLSESAIDGLLRYNHQSGHVFNAVEQIENAMDALDYPGPVVG